MKTQGAQGLWPSWKSYDLDPRRALANAMRAADLASEILSRHYGRLRSVSEKFHAGLVSEADRESEAAIFGLLRAEHPTHSFLGEETGYSSRLEDGLGADGAAQYDTPSASERAEASARPTWIVDPLDGTTNYVHRFPIFCSSIGLEANGELLLGVIDAPKLGMRFHAVRGEGAFLNGEPIRASAREKLNEALFATGFSSMDESLETQYKLLTIAIKEARGIRRAGAAALDLCFVAQGVFDCFWEKNLQPWDMCAGALIAQEAGAIVTDLEGRRFESRNGSALAASPAIHAEVLRRLAEIRRG